MNAKEQAVWERTINNLSVFMPNVAKVLRDNMAEAGKTHTPEQVQRILQAGVDNKDFKGRGKKK